MAYATVDELAAALHIRVTAENTDALQACLDAASTEIEHAVDPVGGVTPLVYDPARQALLSRVNLVRGVEWWKSNDAAFGVIGYAESTGALTAPRDGFARHARTLAPVKEQYGVA